VIQFADGQGNGTVDIDDLLLVVANWNGEYVRGDYTFDAVVDIDDTLAAIGQWGQTVTFGQITVNSGVDNVIGWDGYVFNSELDGAGMYTVRFRHYRPGLGRWLESDPLSYVDGACLFQYVNSSPNRFGDPSGLVGLGLGMAQAYARIFTPNGSAPQCGCDKIDLSFLEDPPGDYPPSRDPNVKRRDNFVLVDYAKLNPDAIQFDGLHALIYSIQEEIEDCRQRNPAGCCCIQSLLIYGHGSAGYQSIGAGMIPEWNDPDRFLGLHNIAALGVISELMCDGAQVQFGGCSVGSGDEGSEFVQKAANVIGVTCSAFTVMTKPKAGGGGPIPYYGDTKFPSDPNRTRIYRHPAATNCCEIKN
jgi:RHS repeat-associated protein